MLLNSAFSKQNPAISLEEWVLVFKVFTTATSKLRVRQCAVLLIFSTTKLHDSIVVS